MKVKTVTATLTTNTAGQVVESIPVLPSEVAVQRADGSWVDPVPMVEDPLGAPIRIVATPVVLNSAGQPVRATPGKGVAWWDQTASLLIDADYVNDRIRFDAASADETSFNTALGVTKSGEQRSFPVYVAPGATELLADGGFASGVDSWTETPATAANGSVAQSAGQLVITATTTGYKVSRAVTVASDQPYRFLCDVVALGGTTAGFLTGGTGSVELASASGTAGISSTGTKETDFSYASTATYIGLNSSGVGTITLDNASLKVCAALKGASLSALSGRISAVAPAAAAAAKTLLYVGDDGVGGLGGRNYLWLYRNTSGNIILAVRRNGSDVALLDLGNVANGAAFTVAFAATTNRFSGSLDGGVVVTDTAGTMPGLAKLRFGRDWAGTAGQVWDGTISRVKLYAEALADAELPDPFESLLVLGDSRAESMSDELITAVAPRSVVEQATGGDSYATTVSVAQGLSSYLKQRNVVLVQYRNTGETLQQCLDGVRGVIAAIGHGRIYIEPMWPGIPETQQSVVDGYNEALLGEFAAYSLGSVQQAAFLADLADRTVGDGIHDDTEHQAIRAGYAKAFFWF